ncbi:MAG: ribosomal protein S18-alanine N-acetyltransferase [Deltaproteobacteria bacterium]|nr:ribosomal protein S18-alanine N-acetyltransferase [Deltaproteobacteria bacterium]
MSAEKKTALPAIRISDMTAEDLDQVMEIEARSFPSPWTKNVFLHELGSSMSGNIVAKLVGPSDGKIAGYLNFWIVSDEVHIHHIAVRQDFRRMGIATKLMRDMFKRAVRKNVRWGTLEVRPSNAAAIRFYETFGFVIKGIRPGYYSDTGEDGLIMWVCLDRDENRQRVAS